MKVLLMHPDRDFDPYGSLLRDHQTFRRDADQQRRLPDQEQALIQDLALDTVVKAMAGNDGFLSEVARYALLSGLQNHLDTILYRQEVLKDCLENVPPVVQLYNLSVEATEAPKRQWWGLFTSTLPSSVLYSSIELLQFLLGMLKKLRTFAEQHRERFHSHAFTTLFAIVQRELSDEYLARVEDHLTLSKFRKGILLSAELGDWNESTNLTLRRTPQKGPNWFERLLGKGPPAYTYHLAERDEAGGRILSDMRNRGISRVAIALAQSADHVLGFFRMLRTELAFYIGCLNLYARLTGKGEPVCFPTPSSPGQHKHRFSGLYDVCLTLHMQSRVVGNTADANGKNVVIVTGANQGGKSTFLRSIGLAQVMMQCGMFVGAEAFEAEVCPALFTHYKREEDTTMKSGKFDEELARMSEIADQIKPNSMVLFNESFAATNEREGSEIATQIVSALLEKRIKVFYVTHLYDFARGFFERAADGALFLRAERNPDGTRPFRLVEGKPLETSYGEDLYREVFADETDEVIVA
jgi:hypothetical protein